VNTHWHGDHLLANSVFKDAFPQAEIIAHSHTLAQANRFYADVAEKSPQRFPKIMADLKARMEASPSSDERIWMQATLDCAELALPELKLTRYVPPDKVVDDQLELDLGQLPIVIRHIGVGNTPGDLVVLVKSDQLVATGDMIVYPSPYAIGSNLEPWPATLERLMSLGATTYVPGHGPVFHDTEYIRDVQQLLKDMRAQLIALYDRKVAKKDAAAQVHLDNFQKKYINSPMRRQAFAQYFIRSAVNKYWTDMESKTPAPEAQKPQ
jgi:glyoxylase-like metal-dependent hydrolase (beta-lactamase superfamily II)